VGAVYKHLDAEGMEGAYQTLHGEDEGGGARDVVYKE
jgi:hypothetical protein